MTKTVLRKINPQPKVEHIVFPGVVPYRRMSWAKKKNFDPDLFLSRRGAWFSCNLDNASQYLLRYCPWRVGEVYPCYGKPVVSSTGICEKDGVWFWRLELEESDRHE